MEFYFNRRSEESEFITDTILEIASPAEVDKFWAIHINHKFWRIDRDLRAVVDLWIVNLATSTRCVLETGSREESIEFSSSYSLRSLSVDTESMFEDFLDSFAFTCRREDGHSPWTVCEFSLEVGEIALVKHFWFHVCFCLREVPFIDHDDDSFFLFEDFCEDVLILLDDSFNRVY